MFAKRDFETELRSSSLPESTEPSILTFDFTFIPKINYFIIDGVGYRWENFLHIEDKVNTIKYFILEFNIYKRTSILTN